MAIDKNELRDIAARIDALRAQLEDIQMDRDDDDTSAESDELDDCISDVISNLEDAYDTLSDAIR